MGVPDFRPLFDDRMNELRPQVLVLVMERSTEPIAVIEWRGSVVETRDEAFAALTSRQIDSAYRLAWAILGDSGDADDATQEAFASAWRHRRSLRDPGRFDAWFGRILVNECRQRLRKRTRERIRPLPEAGPAVSDASGHISARDAVSRAIACLDADHRIVVVLRYWADLSVDEIATRLDVPSGTVKSRLHYALRSMRPRLEDAR
jgi:RNA polymerase sigma factor (sigma-70 family)